MEFELFPSRAGFDDSPLYSALYSQSSVLAVGIVAPSAVAGFVAAMAVVAGVSSDARRV